MQQHSFDSAIFVNAPLAPGDHTVYDADKTLAEILRSYRFALTMPASVMGAPATHAARRSAPERSRERWRGRAANPATTGIWTSRGSVRKAQRPNQKWASTPKTLCAN